MNDNKNLDDNKNTILAIVLSGLVLLAWQYFIGLPQLDKQRQLQQQQQQQAQQGAQPPAGTRPQTATQAGPQVPGQAGPQVPGQAAPATQQPRRRGSRARLR